LTGQNFVVETTLRFGLGRRTVPAAFPPHEGGKQTQKLARRSRLMLHSVGEDKNQRKK